MSTYETSSLIISGCAIFLSVVSLGCSIIFSRLQITHNKNSVKPISFISNSDYEDLLEVAVKNVGTGPLMIKELRITSGNQKQSSETLISLMPHVQQPWNTFIECVDGWTIPVNGNIVLVSISPINADVRTLVRSALAPLTVGIDYTDIYGTAFHDERKLDFFARSL